MSIIFPQNKVFNLTSFSNFTSSAKGPLSSSANRFVDVTQMAMSYEPPEKSDATPQFIFRYKNDPAFFMPIQHVGKNYYVKHQGDSISLVNPAGSAVNIPLATLNITFETQDDDLVIVVSRDGNVQQQRVDNLFNDMGNTGRQLHLIIIPEPDENSRRLNHEISMVNQIANENNKKSVMNERFDIVDGLQLKETLNRIARSQLHQRKIHQNPVIEQVYSAAYTSAKTYILLTSEQPSSSFATLFGNIASVERLCTLFDSVLGALPVFTQGIENQDSYENEFLLREAIAQKIISDLSILDTAFIHTLSAQQIKKINQFNDYQIRYFFTSAVEAVTAYQSGELGSGEGAVHTLNNTINTVYNIANRFDRNVYESPLGFSHGKDKAPVAEYYHEEQGVFVVPMRTHITNYHLRDLILLSNQHLERLRIVYDTQEERWHYSDGRLVPPGINDFVMTADKKIYLVDYNGGLSGNDSLSGEELGAIVNDRGIVAQGKLFIDSEVSISEMRLTNNRYYDIQPQNLREARQVLEKDYGVTKRTIFIP